MKPITSAPKRILISRIPTAKFLGGDATGPLLGSSGKVTLPRRKGRMPNTILIVDDNPLNRETLYEFSKAEEDYEVCAEATNGQEAIGLALKHRPELIILMSGVAASSPV